MFDKRKETRSFKHHELACKCCGFVVMQEGFPLMLQHLRDNFAQPMVINSACRCGDHNAQVRGHPRSLHQMENPVHKDAHDDPLGCVAVDVSVEGKSPSYVGDLIRVAHILGWSVGHGYTYDSSTKTFKGFVHLDRRDLGGKYRTDFWY